MSYKLPLHCLSYPLNFSHKTPLHVFYIIQTEFQGWLYPAIPYQLMDEMIFECMESEQNQCYRRALLCGTLSAAGPPSVIKQALQGSGHIMKDKTSSYTTCAHALPEFLLILLLLLNGHPLILQHLLDTLLPM